MGKVDNALGDSFATMSAQKVAAIACKPLMKNKKAHSRRRAQ
jgi:hypothetical protein